jgi:subtilisin family serine protease
MCAIEYGRDNDFLVMSMSFFLVDSLEAITDEIEAAWDEGHLMVAAAGDSTDAAVGFPAYLPDVIAVTPVKQDSSFWGPEDDEVELAAPGGRGITSTGSINGVPPWNDTIVTDEGIGSSYAAPHVAAAAALLWDLHPSWTNEEIRNRLQATAYDLGDSGWDERYGYGLVDIPAALGITPFSSLSISGPEEIQPEEENCTWEAVVSGGSEPFTYTWRYDGYWVSSGTSWTGGLNPLDEDEEFVLTLWLTDYWYHSISDTLLVTTSELARWCTYK